MSTGAVTPFTPNQPTQLITLSASSQLITFGPCDAVLLYNTSATIPVFITIENFSDAATMAASLTTGMPVPPATQMLLGVPGVTGVGSTQSLALAAIATGAGPVLYVTPGLGTMK
jgi:hypothetical protein